MYLVKYSKSWGGAKKQVYNNQRYDSGFEADYAVQLDLRLKAKDIKGWERQVKIPLDVNGYHICNYYIDFVIYHNDGTKEFVETKGYATDIWRLKWKLFEALFSYKPDTKLTVVKQKDNFRLRKLKKAV